MHLGAVHDFAQMGLRCFMGSCAMMLPAMTLGGVGCVDGPPLIEPAAWLQIRDAYRAGDREAAEAAQRRARDLLPAVLVLGGHRFIACVKAVMTHRLGIDCGDPRQPGSPLTDAERQQVVAKAEELGLGKVEV
jgi:dihydrodipicolinate synthase/N-acetylneuraminate lyase